MIWQLSCSDHHRYSPIIAQRLYIAFPQCLKNCRFNTENDYKKTPSELELLAVFPQKNTHHSVVRSPQKKPRNSQSPRRGLGLRHSRHSAPAAVHSAGLGSGCRWWRPPTAPAAAPPLPRPGRSLGTGKCWRQTSTHLKTQKRGRKVGSQKKYGEIWWNMYWMTIDSKIS